MKQKEKIRNLVILGSWNSLLFNAKWLNDNIYDGRLGEKIKMEIMINGDRIRGRKFYLPDYILEISQERLCFVLNETKQENFDLLIDDVTKLLTKLQHTPIQSMGINFIFFDEKENPFLNASKFYEIENMIEANEIIKIDKKECTLQLSINRKENFIEFNFNYSYKINDISHIKSILEFGLYKRLEDESSSLISKIMEKYNARKDN